MAADEREARLLFVMTSSPVTPASGLGSRLRFGGYQPPKHIPYARTATAIGAGCWFFILYMINKEGGHHFLGHHPWEEPRILAYMDKVDAKYGTQYATKNMHH
ncbi:hypothetical protein CXG81DRAFT_23570 [Caulochytrium protostelioides]|uniref:Uncharacterized protein n=1 Tax=Caulochytrium protostelioides TaxID=1555241 RepID=A0A4V1IVF5_9FUNG|nr:hypothetical protein CXG81DRAFT_23570 [Caulochytrium protostelioides]|eukprot:RKP03879.1 hypothetical protein CXG81DRAFT_23570 [Caulochytrium protostelioides]